VSLRIRLTAITVLLVGLGLVAAAVATHHYLESFMLDRLDQQLGAAQESPAPGSFRSLLPGGAFSGFVDSRGRVFPRDTPRSRADILRDAPPGFSSNGGYRLLSSPAAFGFATPNGPQSGKVQLVTAAPLRDVDATVSELTRDEVIIGVLVLALVGGLAYALIGVGMRPLVRIEGTAAEIAAGDLSRRVEQTDPRTEVGRLGIALNAMLAHIEEAFAERQASENRLRRFVADASHELRTPLTSVRGYAELFRRGAAERPADLANAMRRIEAESARMGVLVDDLLLLAQLDQGRPLERGPVDVTALVEELVADARAIEPDRTVTLAADEGIEVRGDDARLRQAVGNLLANARAHCPPDAHVAVSVRRVGEEAVIEVSDQGPGIDPADLDRVFERFFRSDPSRTRASGGTGLGLSIVASIVEAHGGRAEVSSTVGEGSSFRVVLPLAPAATQGDVRSPDESVTQS
jgi:two-component system OmpR family sensor kinase